MLACGVLGFFMRRFGFSPAALVIALVLGPMAEETLRQTLLISRRQLEHLPRADDVRSCCSASSPCCC